MAVAVCIEAPRIIVRRIVATDLAVPKGSIMMFSGAANTVVLSTGDNVPFAGIAIEEKLATDTDVLTVGCAMDGVWSIDTDGGACAIGEMVNLTAANQVALAVDTDFAQGSLVGKAEEAYVATARLRIRLMGF